jgi:hypothetical protein
VASLITAALSARVRAGTLYSRHGAYGYGGISWCVLVSHGTQRNELMAVFTPVAGGTPCHLLPARRSARSTTDCFAPPGTWDLDAVRSAFTDVETFVYSEDDYRHFKIVGTDRSGNRAQVVLSTSPVDEDEDAEAAGYLDPEGKMKPRRSQSDL